MVFKKGDTMKVYWMSLSLFLVGCSTPLYVKEADTMDEVTVNECRTIFYRNMDNNEVRKREICRYIIMNEQQKSAWKKVTTFDQVDRKATTVDF
jgi:hypothetical protein